MAAMSPATVNARRGDYELGPAEACPTRGGKRASGIGGSARRLTGSATESRKDASNGVGDMHAAPSASAVPGSASRRKSGERSRRSSMFNRDPRPVGDKAFNKLCIETLITFLTARGYDHPISPKLLAAPTGKEFAHIISFMFKQLDPNFRLVGKVEDEVPVMFKRLNYPTNISKTAIQAVGSPHSWPNLLAALVWLVELLNYQRTVDDARAGADAFDDDSGTRAFFDHVTNSYVHFLKGDDESCDRLDEALRLRTMERDGVMNDTVEKLERENAEMEARLELLRGEPSELEAATTELTNLKADQTKFDSYINDLRKHRQVLEKKISERQAEVEGMESDIRSAEASNDTLREKIAGQDVNLEDVEKMLAERKVMDEQMNAAIRVKAAAEREADETEVTVEQKLEELEKVVRTYNGIADRLQLVPASSKRANGVYYELKFHPRATTPTEMVSVDLRNTIKPALVSLRETYQTRIRELGEQLVTAQETSDEAAVRVSSRKDENAAMEAKITELEEEYKVRSSDADTEAGRLAAETEAYKKMTASLRVKISEDTLRSEEIVKEAEAERMDALGLYAQEQTSLNDSLLAAADLLIAHKQNVQDTISSLEQSLGRSEKRQAAIKMPEVILA